MKIKPAHAIATLLMATWFSPLFGNPSNLEFSFEDNPDGTVTLTKYSGSGGEVVIPATIEGKTVSAIGNAAFTGMKTLTKVVIPDTVKTIRDGTGGWVPKAAFSGCDNLNSVVFGAGLEEIGNFAFFRAAAVGDATPSGTLSRLEFPDSVARIGEGAFLNQGSLETVIFGKGTQEIGFRAFENCVSLRKLALGPTLTSIRAWAFQNARSLERVEIPDSVTSLGPGVFRLCGELQSVRIGNGVRTIPRYAFSGCASLSEVALPNQLEEIGAYAFFRCHSLRTLPLPQSLQRVGPGAFEDSPAGESLKLLHPLNPGRNDGSNKRA
jgi:hypothetical protein